MKQADCLRMALAELPQGTMEIVGRPAAEPGVLFTGTFQGETDGRGRMEVYPVFPGVEASFNTVLGTYAAFRHEAARSTLEINHCRLGRVDKILVKSSSRFARNAKECLEAVRELKALGVGVRLRGTGYRHL